MKIMRKQCVGFTLTELMITVVVLSILATMAVPAYQGYARKGKRSDGVAGLLKIQLAEEKWRANNPTYGSFTDIGSPTTEHGYYELGISGNSATGYIATATAQGDQANDEEAGVSCKVLKMTVTSAGVTRTPSECW